MLPKEESDRSSSDSKPPSPLLGGRYAFIFKYGIT